MPAVIPILNTCICALYDALQPYVKVNGRQMGGLIRRHFSRRDVALSRPQTLPPQLSLGLHTCYRVLALVGVYTSCGSNRVAWREGCAHLGAGRGEDFGTVAHARILGLSHRNLRVAFVYATEPCICRKLILIRTRNTQNRRKSHPHPNNFCDPTQHNTPTHLTTSILRRASL